MGVAERRRMHELQHTVLPAREQEIAAICGRAVTYGVLLEARL